ncbi:MAG: MogA/MoaB family molybdenum cofactor biosynthesis protein [Bryobacteraceae bacterium]|nr:MogA/MoaB family molybdenum cofactor biosynthesis protein [Bryobacteraceae bacterium]
MIRAAILTISDSSYAGQREDRSGPAIRQRLTALGWDAAAPDVLPDDIEMISARLRSLADSDSANVVFTTGGTGVAARDITPEATRRVIEREIPGFGERMRAEGRKVTPLADLSRALAGTRGRTLIVNLPGSPKGAVESLDAIVGLVPHVVDLLHGRTEHAATKE